MFFQQLHVEYLLYFSTSDPIVSKSSKPIPDFLKFVESSAEERKSKQCTMTTLKNVIMSHTLLYNNIERGGATDQKEHEEHSTRDQHVPGFCEGHVKDLGQEGIGRQ